MRLARLRSRCREGHPRAGQLGVGGGREGGRREGGVVVCGGCTRVADFEPGFETAVVVVLVVVRLVLQDSRWILAAVRRDIQEDVFNCGVGEDEAEEEEAEEVVAAVPGPSRKVPSIAAELGRFGCFVLGRVVREAKDEASSSAFGSIVRVAGHEGGGCSGEREGVVGRSGSLTGDRGPIGEVLATS